MTPTTTFQPKVFNGTRGNGSNKSMTIRCPFCGARARGYGAANQMSDHVTHHKARCTNLDCSASFDVQFAIIKVIQQPVVNEPSNNASE